MSIEEDFTEIYHMHAAKVYSLCLGYASGDEMLAKDWQQETFVKVWNHRKSFKGHSAIGTWIYRIAVNVCLSDLRKPKLQRLSNDRMPPAEAEDTEERSQDEKLKKMYRCINQLTEQNKALILLELEEIPQATIAETVGLAHGAVRTRLSRIRKALLKCMTNGK
ncbi:MAG: RNA polymerase sigma factor [Bacteroidota bacterium]